MEINVLIEGIHCGGCITGFENRLYQYGVSHFDMDLSTRIATITFDENDLDVETILKIIASFGNRATIVE